MSNLIAIQPSVSMSLANAIKKDLFSWLKREILLFDQIGICNLDSSVSFQKKIMLRIGRDFPELEYEWLKANRIIFNPLERGLWDSQSYDFLMSERDKNTKNTFKILENFGDSFDLSTTTKSLVDQDSEFLRLLAIKMEEVQEKTVVTTMPFINYIYKTPHTSECTAMEIAINNLPLPHINTPWEQIIDYRNDPDNQKKLLALRRWIRKTSTQGLSSNEIEQELEWLINEFENHMKLHNMKANTETLEVLVKTPLEIIEDLIRLKFSKIPDPLFALKKRQINLMEAELNAPGREMAYIIKARDTFQSD